MKKSISMFKMYSKAISISSALFLLLLNLTYIPVSAQLPYTVNQYPYDSLINMTYGTAINYIGVSDTLTMDIYKPVGDNNCLRPVVILVHGGAWISGSKQDFNMVALAREFAGRGYVAVSVNYRLGTHKSANYDMYPFCNTTISQPCGYIADSAEIYRANFRAMQDVKGAVRFMKDRNSTDSTDTNNIFLIGESAGGFVSLAAAFTDQTSEKSLNCGSIADVPTPDNDFITYGCLPNAVSLVRPDLGSIHGTLHTGNHDATVKGVASLYGGVFNMDIFQQVSDTPVVYLFHQGADVVVSYDFDRLLGRTSWECYAPTNICQPYYFYPYAFGGESMRQQFIQQGNNAPPFMAEIVYNYNYSNNCFSNGHSIDNFSLRLQSMVNLFAGRIQSSGNNPLFNCSAGITDDYPTAIILYPNPVCSYLNVETFEHAGSLHFIITDTFGRKVKSGDLNPGSMVVDFISLPAGMYLYKLSNKAGVLKTGKLIKE